jgi:hypothetical protein
MCGKVRRAKPADGVASQLDRSRLEFCLNEEIGLLWNSMISWSGAGTFSWQLKSSNGAQVSYMPARCIWKVQILLDFQVESMKSDPRIVPNGSLFLG